MIESNNEKTFGKKSKNWDKLIQSGTPGQHTKNRDCLRKTGAVGMFVSFITVGCVTDFSEQPRKGPS